jgi:hypothetical protein
MRINIAVNMKISMPAKDHCDYISPFLVNDVLTLQNSKYSSLKIAVYMKISMMKFVSTQILKLVFHRE